MNPAPPHPRDPAEIEREAAHWVLRRDRGLTAPEQDDFSQWLAADSRHGEALALHRWGWDELDRLTGLQTSLGAVPDPDLFAPRRVTPRRMAWFASFAFAAAAVVALGIFLVRRAAPAQGFTPPAASAALVALCERRDLPDGSVVELNRGAAIEVAFGATVRHVRLVRGEANFIVAKDPSRPFIVNAGGVEIRAVGTVFNVRLDHSSVDVLVSVGVVQVVPPVSPAGASVATSSVATSTAAPAPHMLEAGQQAVVFLEPAAVATPPQILHLSPAEVGTRLAWLPRMLDFTATPLAEIVENFNRGNPVQLTLADPALGALRLSASFRSDNVEGFVRLMVSDFGLRAVWRSETEIVLIKSP